MLAVLHNTVTEQVRDGCHSTSAQTKQALVPEAELPLASRLCLWGTTELVPLVKWQTSEIP